jgi:hypothetical protein
MDGCWVYQGFIIYWEVRRVSKTVRREFVKHAISIDKNVTERCEMEELFKYSGQYKLEQYIKLKEYITQGGVLKTRMHVRWLSDWLTLGEMHLSKNSLMSGNSFYWRCIVCLFESRNFNGTFLFEKLKLKGLNRI